MIDDREVRAAFNPEATALRAQVLYLHAQVSLLVEEMPMADFLRIYDQLEHLIIRETEARQEADLCRNFGRIPLKENPRSL